MNGTNVARPRPWVSRSGWHSRAPARWRPCAVRISFPQAERMAAMSRIRFSSGSPWPINACAHTRCHLPPRASTTRATSTTPAVSASWFTPRATARTLSSGTPSSVLMNLEHRGACGCEANTGDGAGILIQMPDRFFRKEAARLRIPLPAEGWYGAGLVFLPKDADARSRVTATIERIVRRGRAAAARLARRADRRQRARSACCRGGAGLQTALHRPRRPLSPTATRSSASCT